MLRSKSVLPCLLLTAAGTCGPVGCGEGEDIAAMAPDQLQEAQKLRSASLKGEGSGAAPRIGPAGRRSAPRR